MSDAAATKTVETRPRAGRDSFPIVNAGVLYAGSLVQLSAGFLDDWDDAGAGSTFMGLLIGGDTSANASTVTDGRFTGDTSPNSGLVPEGRVDTSGVVLMHLDSINGTPTQAKVGDLIYAGSSNLDDLDLQASGNTDPVGWLIRFRASDDCDVQLFTPSEFLAQQTA